VSAVCGLSRLLDMRTVAEGVETQLHLERVAAAGCNEAQGYHFSRPVSASEVATAITASERILSKAGLASSAVRLSVA